ncbi:MAG: hypothetical protein ACLGHN_13850 [Bacteriovoracia bacterium]
MTLSKIHVLFQALLLIALSAHANDVIVRLQKDFYLKKNACNKTLSNYLNTISFKLDFPKGTMPKNYIIGVVEKNSKFSQTIFFNGVNWFYPTWQGHTEYRLPDCTRAGCEARFFVFLTELPIRYQSWSFDVSVFDTTKKNERVLQKNYPVENVFMQSGYEHFETLDLKHIKNNLKAKVDKEKVKKLLAENYQVQFIFQWRENKDQQQYSEEAHLLKPDHKWLTNENQEFKMTKKLKNPTYLGFMVYVTKNNRAYESKVEVLNQNDSFYDCR